jgi:CheY-like chemotaxis protein
MSNTKSTKKTILIVDDNKDNLRVLAEYIQSGGYEIILSDNGAGACQAAEQYIPNAILLDIMMPGIDGYETCRMLKNNSITENIPVIFVTARSEVDSFEEGLKAGAADYVTKPFDPEVLIRRLNLHIENAILKETLQKNNTEFTQLKKMADLGCWFLKMRPYIKNIPEDILFKDISFLCSNSESFIKNTLDKPSAVKDETNKLPLEKDKSFMYNQLYKNLLISVFGSTYNKNYKEISPFLEDIGENNRYTESKNFFHFCEMYFSLISQDLFSKNESINLPQTLQNIVSEKKNNNAKVDILLNLDSSSESIIYGSKKYFDMLLRIFIDNALEASSIKNLTIGLEKKHIPVKLFGIQKEIIPNNYLVLSFSNNGKVIPECNKQRIFDPFFSRKTNHIGLGLSYALKIIDLFNANITFYSSKENNTNFSILFPV